MWYIAQAAGTSAAKQDELRNIFEIVTGVFSRADTLAHPNELLTQLQSLSMVWSVVFLSAGLVCMLNGYKFYKPVTVLLAMAIGAFTGYAIGMKINAQEYIIAGCLGALTAVACLPLMKYAIAALGGLAGSFIGANAWTSIAYMMGENGQPHEAVQHHWVGALIGLIVFGMLSFILFKASIVVFTSISGSTLAVMGGMALLLQVPEWRESVAKGLSSHAIVLPLLVAVPALIGFILQESQDVSHAEEQ